MSRIKRLAEDEAERLGVTMEDLVFTGGNVSVHLNTEGLDDDN